MSRPTVDKAVRTQHSEIVEQVFRDLTVQHDPEQVGLTNLAQYFLRVLELIDQYEKQGKLSGDVKHGIAVSVLSRLIREAPVSAETKYVLGQFVDGAADGFIAVLVAASKGATQLNLCCEETCVPLWKWMCCCARTKSRQG